MNHTFLFSVFWVFIFLSCTLNKKKKKTIVELLVALISLSGVFIYDVNSLSIGIGDLNELKGMILPVLSAT